MSRDNSIAALRRFMEGATSRLTRQIALAAFVVVCLLQLLLLWSAYVDEYRNQIDALEQESRTAIYTAIAPYADKIGTQDFTDVRRVLSAVSGTSRVRGGVIFDGDGQEVSRFGEPMYRQADELGRSRFSNSRSRLEGYMDSGHFHLPMSIAYRLDASAIDVSVSHFLWRALGVVLVVSILITIAIMFVMGHLVVAPLLSLRSSLIAAGNDPINASSFKPSLRRDGVLGDLTRIIQSLLQRVSQTFREELATFAAMVNKTGDGMVAYDADNHLVYANASFLNLVNKASIRELNKCGGPRFRIEGEGEPFSLDQLLKRGEFKGEVDLVCEDAEPRRCLMSAAILRTRDGRFLRAFASLSDITTIHDVQGALEEKNRQLEEANRTKSEFLAQMSHELRTPLNAIIGFSEILSNRSETDPGDMVESFSKDINDSGHHLLGLINNILDLSKMEAGKQDLTETDVDIVDLAQSSLTMVRKVAASRDVNLMTTLPADPLYLRGDAVRLKQVLLNLLSNAIKFTDAGGSVTLNIERTQDGIRVSVTDTGIGMNPEDVPRALQPFAQIDSGISRKYEGTGLGLPITAGLVELHGGKMDVQSEKGVGTTVSFVLPKSRLVDSAAA